MTGESWRSGSEAWFTKASMIYATWKFKKHLSPAVEAFAPTAPCNTIAITYRSKYDSIKDLVDP